MRKKPTMYRIVYVSNGCMFLGFWWRMRERGSATQISGAALEGVLYDIEVK